MKRIARRVASYTAIFAQGLQSLGYKLRKDTAFDTVWIAIGESSAPLIARALNAGINLRKACDKSVSISLDETTTREDIHALWQVFASESTTQGQAAQLRVVRKRHRAPDP